MRCYNVRHMARHQVGVRELRQNLSVYLRRVVAGEALEVTDRGKPVAVLAPLEKPTTLLQRLVAAGRATAPQRKLRELEPPAERVSNKLSRALEAERAERLGE